MVARALTFTLVLLTSALSADAQIIQAVNRFANAGEPVANTNAAVEQKEDDKGALLLSQASAQGLGTDSAQIALQALDLWLSRKTRLYARLTLPLKAEPAAKPAEAGAPAEAATKPADRIVRQLVDPYGGIVNLSGGLFTQLRKRNARSAQERAILLRHLNAAGIQDAAPVIRSPATAAANAKAALAAAEALASKMQPDHGAFLDVRGGIKMIDLPNPGTRAVELGGSKLNIFYTGIAGLKVITPLYKRPVDPGDAGEADLAGGVTLGAYLVGNHAADETQSDIFSTALNRSTAAFTAIVGVNLPGIAGLTFSMTPWTNDSRMGKVFVFSFDVLRPTRDDKKS